MRSWARVIAGVAAIALVAGVAVGVYAAVQPGAFLHARPVGASAVGSLAALNGTGARTVQPSGDATQLGIPAARPLVPSAETTPARAGARTRTGAGSAGAAFNVDAAMATIRALAAMGPRLGGSPAEAKAAAYLRDRMVGLGLDARVEEFKLPNGTTSRNVIARLQGSTNTVIVLGAHMDTKPPSPGANDNASGCAALVEIARVLSAHRPVPTVEFVFFGSEETNGGDKNGHHFGSRHRVAAMSAAERANTAGMISVDMVGYGTSFHSRTMGSGPLVMSNLLLGYANGAGVRMTYLRDPGRSGWSDHEAYERAGIPVSWVEWRDDPVYHTARDVPAHLQAGRVATAGRVVLGFVESLDGASLTQLLAR